MFGRASYAAALAAVCAVGFWAGTAQALTYNKTFTLTSSDVVPPVSSSGFGAANVTVDVNTATNQLSWSVIFLNLSSPVNAVTFNSAAAGANGPMVLDIGNISGFNSPLIGSTTLTSQQEQDIFAGLWYINIATVNHPTGELRGQLPPAESAPTVVPEPASMGLLGLALVGLATRMKRR